MKHLEVFYVGWNYFFKFCCKSIFFDKIYNDGLLKSYFAEVVSILDTLKIRCIYCYLVKYPDRNRKRRGCVVKSNIFCYLIFQHVSQGLNVGQIENFVSVDRGSIILWYRHNQDTQALDLVRNWIYSVNFWCFNMTPKNSYIIIKKIISFILPKVQ